jgi:N-acetylated-alpha-linked acidic dipeptidase
MRRSTLLFSGTLLLVWIQSARVFSQQPAATPKVLGYRDFAAQQKIDDSFLAVPDAKLAGEHLKILTAAPHWASSPEDYATAKYVEEKFNQAGLATEIVPYRVLLNKPVSILVDAFDAQHHLLMHGPTPEHVDPKAYGGDPYQDDPRVLPAFNGSSPSGDVTAQVVYANYGTREDFAELDRMGISLKGKIVIVRYGGNFRGVKVYIAQQHGAAGVLIYSDPADDGYTRGDMYPRGPERPASAVQRGSVQFLPIYAGDPTTPGIASTMDLPDSKRIPVDKLQDNQPSIPSNPLSYKDAAPILEALGGANVPHAWQGGLPFAYHIGGTDSVTVHMKLVQDNALRVIWDVIGKIPGSDPAEKNDWVVAGNHRDAWVYGAVDPNSGTAAMLEAVHGLGVLLKQGWHPKRTIVIGSWDAEEEGLVGSTEWAEQHAAELDHAVAYFNTDVGVSGPQFNASAVPSLKQFVRELTREVPSPAGGTVYDQWLKRAEGARDGGGPNASARAGRNQRSQQATAVPPVGNLGSGSDYSPFFQHLGVPSTDIGSDGPYGVYHSVFDDYNWFIRNADPTFAYEQQQARVFGLEVLHMADADVLPYDDAAYGEQIEGFLDRAAQQAQTAHMAIDFAAARTAAQQFTTAGRSVLCQQSDAQAGTEACASTHAAANSAELNRALRSAETDLLSPSGLPRRSWYRHTIFSPGEYTGYAAVVLPGVTEAISNGDAAEAKAQLAILVAALHRAVATLQAVKQ